MDAGITLTNKNPRKGKSIFSTAVFAWMYSILRVASKKELKLKDLHENYEADNSEKISYQLEKNWNEEIIFAKAESRQPSFKRVITKTFWFSYCLNTVWIIIMWCGIRAIIPAFLSELLKLFKEKEITPEVHEKMFIYGSAIVLLSTCSSMIMHHTNFYMARVGMRMRTATSALIYKKLLRLSKKSLNETAAGKVVNLLSNDVNRFDYVVLYLNYGIATPFQAAILTYLIWREVQVAAFAGLVTMICLSVPVQGFLGKLTPIYRLKVAQKADFRVKLMSELIKGMQVIKMYAWEKPFERLVRLARKSEVSAVTKASYLRAFYLGFVVFTERVALFVTLVTYVYMDNSITADKVFSLAQYYNTMQAGMSIFLPTAISMLTETMISLDRLEEFLLLEEKSKSAITKEQPGFGIELDQVSASWVSASNTLSDISIKVQPGKSCALVGTVGSGKSSLLQLLLGELASKKGSIKIGGAVSYCSQEPWLFVSTVRNNILFGLPYDSSRYKEVVRVCALEQDFRQFPDGDRTLVGERGVSLSGGQRARINLARAVYKEADIYLLDDPLSAVDTHVGKHLVDQCINHFLRNKTRVIVTHQLQFMSKMDHIVVINNGIVEAQGNFAQITNSNVDFTKLIASNVEGDEKKAEPEKNTEVTRKISVISLNGGLEEKEIAVAEEDGETMKGSLLLAYFRAGGSRLTLFCLFLILVIGQFSSSGADYWVTYWTSTEAEASQRVKQEFIPIAETRNSSNMTYEIYQIDGQKYNQPYRMTEDNTDGLTTDQYVFIYTGIIIATCILTLSRILMLFKVCMKASKNLHKFMFHCLLQAPMRFFDTNPSGTILNRFSKDMGAIDELLPRFLGESIQIILVASGTLVLIAVSNYYTLISMVVLGVILNHIRKVYIPSVKTIKELEGVAKSPVFSHLSASFNGISTIRASQIEKVLIDQFDKLQDVHTSTWFLLISTKSAFGLWLDLSCIFLVASSTYSFIGMTYLLEVDGSKVGLAISQALLLTGMLQFGVTQTAEVFSQLISVGRVLQYTQLDKEGPFETTGDLPKDWPKEGVITFKDTSLKYAPNDPPVLRKLNFTVPPGQKVGIVGRTGAGKSSLISALFRLAPLEGEISIDDIDSQSIGLQDLRSKISIIPQEPVLFSETIRYNLDPFNDYKDYELWKAIEEVELKEAVPSLDFLVQEGGQNFSLGQRQLVCLARALLRKNKILVLDEATANVDPKTDALIQRTIRQKFCDCTVLTIAHRLNTIMDSDMVLVMQAGTMVEYDPPFKLLRNAKGVFYSMVAETGHTMTQQLHRIAEESFLNRIQEDETETAYL